MKCHVACTFIQSDLWESIFFPTVDWLERVCHHIFQVVFHPADEVEISFLFADDATITQYNHQYRRMNKATNVLAFPTYETGSFILLGDILCAFETIAREAKQQRKTFQQHLTHLIVHGVLHLLGYDHEGAIFAEEMENLEIQILAQLDIPNPYSGLP